MLDSFGALETSPDAALDLYFRQCSIRVTTEDLAGIGATIANGGVNPRTGRVMFSHEIAQRMLSVMTTCGMYDGAGDWVTSVGLPAKSGVGGGILAVLPGQLGIGVYSPRLDEHGNSVRGVETCEHLSRDLGLHMFNVTRESRVTIRSVYDLTDIPVSDDWTDRERSYLRTCRDKVRVYELQGDLTFAGAESVHRRLLSDMDDYAAVIVEISRLGVVDAVARTMILSIERALSDTGRRAALVDPDGIVRAWVERQREAWTNPKDSALVDLKGFDPALPHVHATMEEAILDVETFLLKDAYDE